MHLRTLWNVIKDTYIFIIIVWLIFAIILRTHRQYRIYLAVSSVVYVAVLLYVTLLGRSVKSEPQMELSFLWEYRLAFGGSLYWFSQIFDNIMLFVPMGWLYGEMREAGNMLDKSSWNGALIFAICASFIIEFCQLVFKLGLFEFDDIFNNTVGMMVGYGLYWLIVHRHLV